MLISRDPTLQAVSGVYAHRGVVLLSCHPVFEAMRSVLTVLCTAVKQGSRVPLERIALCALRDTPYPAPGCRVVMDLGGLRTAVHAPAPGELPLLNVRMDVVFARLGLSTILFLLRCLFSEQRVLLHSRHLALLTPTYR